jgi:hypothetical protein
VLLDGIDEVPDAKRRDIRESIDNYFRQYRDAQFVVTSRPAAVKDPAWGELFGSCRAAVQGMAPVDIESFVEQWYEALADRGAPRSTAPRSTGSRARSSPQAACGSWRKHRCSAPRSATCTAFGGASCPAGSTGCTRGSANS